ncbi:ANTAR domain-containing protein [Streptomyces sp. NPDC002285]
MGQITPDDGFTVLREISQHTNIKLHQVAEEILKHAQGAPLPEVLHGELHTALARHAIGERPDP